MFRHFRHDSIATCNEVMCNKLKIGSCKSESKSGDTFRLSCAFNALRFEKRVYGYERQIKIEPNPHFGSKILFRTTFSRKTVMTRRSVPRLG